MDPKLLQLRSELDEINQIIIELLAKRFEVTKQVGELKRDAHLPAKDPVREKEQKEKLLLLAKEHRLNPELIDDIFKLITTEVVENHNRLQDPMK